MTALDIFGLSEGALRISAFLGILLLMVALESLAPRRVLTQARTRRWGTNLAIVFIGSLLVRAMGALAAPLLAVGAALWAAEHGVGLFHVIDVPTWLAFIATLVLLDLLVWGQHWASHRLPLFWRLHRVHHADRDIDASTALRFHPLEFVVSMLIKVAAVLLLGPSAVAVVIFEIVLNGTAIFNHANVRLPPALDRVLRLFIVTPDMHRVHHSVHAGEHNRNFGFNLSIWDRLFGTYVAQPRDGHHGMHIGLPAYQFDAPNTLWWSLKLPVLSTAEPLRAPAARREA